MKLIDQYKLACEKYGYQIDIQQLAVIEKMQQLRSNLLAEQKRRDSFWGRFRRRQCIKGLYLWGSVGIGKTFLMDCFYDSLDLPNKQRIHFHDFMREIHVKLKALQGQKNPLHKIAKEYAASTIILCLDEIIVTDITDAMLLGKFLQLLFKQGVCLVTTSNTEPDMLYYRGLQRQQFLPAIAAIKKHTDIQHIDTTMDYRQLFLKKSGVFHIPHNQHAIQTMEETFDMLGHGEHVDYSPIHILERDIHVVKRTQTMAWFEFNVICNTPRSQRDYLELVKHYDTFFVSHIPHIPQHANNTINLFIRFIDILYDAKAHLFCSLEKPIDDIYTEGNQLKAFARTASRLNEMRSVEYATRASTLRE